VELLLDSPLPGSTMTASPPCPEDVEVSGVASTIGIPPQLDVFFVVDQSGSTGTCSGVDVNGNGIIGTGIYSCSDPGDSILAAEVAAVRAVVDAVDPQHVRIAVIAFDTYAAAVVSLTDQYDLVHQALDDMLFWGPGGQTNFVDAIEALLIEFEQHGDPANRHPISLFLSDGEDTLNTAEEIEAAAQQAADDGVRIDTFGVGTGADPVTLEMIAQLTQGQFYPLLDPADILSVLPEVILVGIDHVIVRNLTTGQELTETPALDGSFSLPLPITSGLNAIEVVAVADDADATEVSCLTDVTLECGNSPPELSCLDPVMCNAPGLCAADVACDQGVALCTDPDGDPLEVSCLPGETLDVGTHQVEVSCSDGLETVNAVCSVTVNDCEPPRCQSPPPRALECNGPGGVPVTEPEVQLWLASASATDNCATTELLNDAPDTFPSGCIPGLATTVGWTAVDASDNWSMGQSSLTVTDSQPPRVSALLQPLLPQPPAEPSSAQTACSAPAVRSFSVVCGGGADRCDPEPATLTARLLVTRYDVPQPWGPCNQRTESFDVQCSEQVEIQLLPAQCPASPTAPLASHSVNADGVQVFRGEQVVLEVSATDSCGNLASSLYDPAQEPSPLCDQVLADGSCCPAVAQPAPPSCPVPVCGDAGSIEAPPAFGHGPPTSGRRR
jgi:Mg-chelatase subunit ChlD